MAIELLTKILISVLPVVVFLLILIFLDSYKLVKLPLVLLLLLLGFLAALVCLYINNGLQVLLNWDNFTYSRYAAPLVEEVIKAAYIIYLIRSRKIGFMVDAAILGFALGTGFAIFENIYKLMSLADSNLFLWIVRGFGTAIMHGGATAIFGIVSKGLAERRESEAYYLYLPGMISVILFHSLFNHFLIPPAWSAGLLMVFFPLVIMLVYQHSEKATKNWLGMGLDTDAELLDQIITGHIAETRLGQYLLSLKEHFPGAVVADMLCLLRIHLELSMQAKGLLLMREHGLDVPPDPDIRAKFEELNYLEKSVGRTGRLAILPFLRWNSRDLWQLHMLSREQT